MRFSAKMGDNERIEGIEGIEDLGPDVETVDCETITMLDVLQEEQDLEADAFAVLGGSDDKNCTYLKGYVSRQALYACNTCQLVATTAADADVAQRAAICLACSYRCHDGHDLIELYTKRNFRCDCGNDKFAESNCKLYSKSGVNVDNQYNHNFDGKYCVCLRPYPDPEDDVDDQMIQCVVCEDWYHGRHLGNFDENVEFSEMICNLCVTRLPFLWFYNKTFGQKIEANESNADIDVLSAEQKESPKVLAMSEPSMVCSDSQAVDSGIENSCDSMNDSSGKLTTQCKLNALKSVSNVENPPTGQLEATYWPMEWRRLLCKCKNCMTLYSDKKCMFLTDEKDMVHYYEKEGMQSNTRQSDYDKGLSELGKMDRIQQIEYISGYNDLQNSLKEYLRTFAESKRTVREEDIKEFFQQMSARKKQKLDIPYNCK
ncbi:unnamed protein product [Medioppia subpectinata]|uniref:UBR-type domain-containing protein n=1 Tax=Medioppia subpectinata TaxID=1979941 RepID=A0A7R9KCN0_9ACAR|nr:unnamed protein product [Medioppia subpectinata]CAG2101030.1 unnamed protein product [Medioppia subpectinata]